MSASPRAEWLEDNQRVLVLEIARLSARLDGFQGHGATPLESVEPTRSADSVEEELQAARASMPIPPAIDRVAAVFGLTDFERSLLLLAAGVELDARLAQLCARATGSQGAGAQGAPWPTLGLALACLPDPDWSALAPSAPLRHWRFVHLDEREGLVTARVRIDERVLHELTGVTYLDSRLESLLLPAPSPELMHPQHGELVARLLETLRAQAERGDTGELLVQLCGEDTETSQDVATRVAETLGLTLRVLEAEDLPDDPGACAELARLWSREAALAGDALLVQGDKQPALRRLVERAGGLVFLVREHALELVRRDLRVDVPRVAPGDQRELWRAALGPAATHQAGPAIDRIAGQFHFNARTIADLARRALADQADAESNGDDGASPSLDPGALWDACRRVKPGRLGALVQRIEPTARWDDLVLPPAQLAMLERIVEQVRHRELVQERWGFAARSPRGLGISALFAGDSGTGKTLAAEVIAGALQLDLYRVDLSAVVSKYIGETEKNLRRVFDAAEASGAVLLFDEADALFGKRSEVKDSHDRYANIEVSYLLQRMESYRGLAILTTNQRTALDGAFQRRLRFVVSFPFPDQSQREAIWRGIFPRRTPTDGLDYPALARLNVSGGHIKGIAIHAAFRAAARDEPVGMPAILRAARAEAAQRGVALSAMEVAGWE